MKNITDLTAHRTKMQQDFEAARDAAEAVANEESQALSSDNAYATWMRQKKLADLNVARLARELDEAADEIEAEQGRQQRDALLKRYNAVKTRNVALQTRLAKFRDEVAPQLLALIRDLAQDEVDVQEINRLVPHSEQLQSADVVARCAPAIQKSATRLFTSTDAVPPLWKTLVLPRLGQHGGPLFDGTTCYSPSRALEILND